MRIITGSAKGRKLLTPPGISTRPTTGLVKESVFSIIQFEVPGAAVLDLFAGSGQMGVEALSRGARSCVFVENSKAVMSVIESNLKAAGFLAEAKLVLRDALIYAENAQESFDIAFLDPPYGYGLERILPAVGELMRDNGIIVCETKKEEVLPEQAGRLNKHKDYRYGKTKMTIYRNVEEQE
jgi:16S rRNA (guanine(966)-N(2))-methyltransferase RsmD